MIKDNELKDKHIYIDSNRDRFYELVNHNKPLTSDLLIRQQELFNTKLNDYCNSNLPVIGDDENYSFENNTLTIDEIIKFTDEECRKELRYTAFILKRNESMKKTNDLRLILNLKQDSKRFSLQEMENIDN